MRAPVVVAAALLSGVLGFAPLVLAADAPVQLKPMPSQNIGIGAVLIHAKSDAAKRFYMGCAEFIEYPADSRILFLPIGTVVKALS